MSLPDECMSMYFRLLTDLHFATALDTIREHPRDAKSLLARSIVTWLHGAGAGSKAEEYFNTVHRDKEIPENIPEDRVMPAPWDFDLTHLVSFHFQVSRTTAVQKIREGAIRLDGSKVADPQARYAFDKPVVLQFGKRKFVRLVPIDAASAAKIRSGTVATTVENG